MRTLAAQGDRMSLVARIRTVRPESAARWGRMSWLVLYLPVRWPRHIPTSPEIDQERGGTKRGGFAADVDQVEALLEIVAAPSTKLAGTPHPMFGKMSRAEWLRWGYLHVDHHLRQFGA